MHCYALNARDSSPARAAVERESVNMCEGNKIKWREERVKREGGEGVRELVLVPGESLSIRGSF